MTESYIEKKVCKWAEDHGIMTFKLGGSGDRGKPDRVFIGGGSIIFAEFKRPGGKLRKNQQRMLDKLMNHGAKCYVFDSVPGAVAGLRTEFLNAADHPPR